MGKYVRWLDQGGIRVLLVNASGLPEAEYIAALEEAKQELLKERTGPPVLMDLTKTKMTAKTHNKAKELADATRAAGIPDGPIAVAGLSMLAKSTARLLQREAHFTDTIDEGKEWLAREVQKRQKR